MQSFIMNWKHVCTAQFEWRTEYFMLPQYLSGNIRVFCRVRPLRDAEHQEVILDTHFQHHFCFGPWLSSLFYLFAILLEFVITASSTGGSEVSKFSLNAFRREWVPTTTTKNLGGNSNETQRTKLGRLFNFNHSDGHCVSELVRDGPANGCSRRRLQPKGLFVWPRLSPPRLPRQIILVWFSKLNQREHAIMLHYVGF